MLQYKTDKQTFRIVGGELWTAPLLLLPPGMSTVLDLGGGSGNFGVQLKTTNNTVFNLDMTSKRFGRDFDIKHIVGDMLLLPFKNNYFDVVLARAVLHHTPKLDKALIEVQRVLKPGGFLLIEEPGAFNPVATIIRKTISTTKHDPDEKPFNSKVLLDVTSQRFKILKVEYHNLLSYIFPFVVSYIPKVLKQPMRKVAYGLVKLDKKLLKNKVLQNFCGYVMILCQKIK